MNEKDWLELTRSESRDSASDMRFMFSIAVSYLLISITVLGIGYAISESVSQSMVQLLDENQNLSVNASQYISWQATQKAESLNTWLLLGVVAVIGAIGLLLYSSFIIGGRKRKIEKLYFDILRNKIQGSDEESRCNAIEKRYLEIIKRKKIFGGSNEMLNNKWYLIIIGIIILVIGGGLYYLTKNAQLVFSALVACATLIYAYLTYLLVGLTKDMRDYQKEQREPNINIDFQHEENNMHMVYMIIENIGKNTAYKVNINIAPDMPYAPGNKLSDLSIIKNQHDIPANKRIKFFLTSLLQDTEEKTKEPYKIIVDYENDAEDPFHKEFEIDLKMLLGAMFTRQESPYKVVSDSIDGLKDTIKPIVDGKSNIKVTNYSKKEAEKEKNEEAKKNKKLLEKMKKEHEKKANTNKEVAEKNNSKSKKG